MVCSDKCGLWVHKKCYTPLKNVSRPWKHNKNDTSDNIWHQFLFADDYFADDKTVLSETQSNSDLDTLSSTDNWKVFNKRGQHLIHLNINSVLSKIDELRVIAKESRASVIE